MKTHRLARVAEAIREVASETILFELRDPRVKRVTVIRAEVSGDMQHAKVYISIMGTEREQALTMHGLRSATGFIQAKLADRLQTRYTPHLTFVMDESVKKSIEITRLINEALGKTEDKTLADVADNTTEADIETDDEISDEIGGEEVQEEQAEQEAEAKVVPEPTNGPSAK
jgi:ribosome-binding factor A